MALDDKYDDIKKLIDAGKEKGYLTYDQVNDLIPHDVHSPEDLEDLLARLVPHELNDRERLVRFLIGPRTEQIPFRNGQLCLGTWQRVLLLGFNGSTPGGWILTSVG